MNSWKMIANFALFQVGWFLCVYSAASNAPLLGTTAALLVVLAHLLMTHDTGRELGLILVAGLIGGLWESLLVIQNWYVYSTGMLYGWMAPHWIIAMWMMFATTLNASLGWMKRSYWIAAAVGALFAPVAYYAGYRLGAVALPDVGMALLAQAAGWAVLLPVLTLIAELVHEGGPVENMVYNRLVVPDDDV